MSENIHPLAAHHIPSFLPGPDGSDPLMTVMIVALIALVILVGSLYLHLHALPERVVHGNERMQMEIVAILALVALFTHNNLFWIAALLLAFVKLPDFSTPLESIASSLARLSGRNEPTILPDSAPTQTVAAAPDTPTETSSEGASSRSGADAPSAEKE